MNIAFTPAAAMRRHGRGAVAFLLAVVVTGAAACGREATRPSGDGRTAVWLDASPAIGDPPRDPGDAFAVLQAFGSGRLQVRGLSITFGNVPLVRGYPAAVEMLERIDSGLLRPWRGASSPEERAAPTESTELLEEALTREPLTVIALGPATTLASVLIRQPDIVARMERVVLVAGQPRRHDVARPRAADPNVDADPESLRLLLESAATITLVSADVSTGIGFDAADLSRLDAGTGPIKLVLPGARAWLQATTNATGAAAFPIGALLAVDVAAHPGEIRCEVANAALEQVANDDAANAAGAARLALLVSSEPGARGRRVTWCHTADPGAKARIVADLLRLQPRR